MVLIKGMDIPRHIAICPYCDGTLFVDEYSDGDVSLWCRQAESGDDDSDHLFLADIYWSEVEAHVITVYQEG